MKKFYSLLILVCFVLSTRAQTTYTWQGANNASWAVSTNWTPTRTTPAANDILQFNDGTSKTITALVTQTVGTISVTNNTTIVLQAAAARTITVGNGTGTDLTIATGSSLTLSTNVNMTMAGNATGTIDGTLAIIAGRTFNSNNAGVITTVNGTIDNSGTVTCSNATRLVFAAGSTYIHNVNNVSLPTATWNTTSLLNVTGVTATALAGLGQAFGNITWNCASQTLANMNFNQMTAINNLTLISTGSGSIRIANNATNRLVPTTGSLNNFTMSGGSFDLATSTGSGTINVAGNFDISGGTITESGTSNGAINFTGTSTQTYTKSGGTFSNNINFAINAGATVDFGTSVLDGSAGTFTLASTGKIITSNAGGIPSTITVTGTKSYNSGADYEFRGAATGTFTTTPTAATVRNLTVNNTGGDVTLSQPLTVNGVLALTAGALTTTAVNLVTVSATGSTSGTSYVNGPMSKVGTTAFTFPVGKSGAGLHTIGIGTPSASATVTAEYFRSNPHAFGSTYGGSLIQISGCEYWTLNRTAGGGTGRVVLSWESTSACGGTWGYVGSLGGLAVARLNGGTWADEGSFGTTGNTVSGTLTSNTATLDFTATFALGTTTTSNALPVMFADVKAFQKNSGVQVEWTNLTERDMVSYTVERSADGQSWATINQQAPRSNVNDRESYATFDGAPFNGVNFYRIKALDISGKIVLSKTMKVDINSKQNGFAIFPNPVRGNQLSLSFNLSKGQYTVKVLNGNGQQVMIQRISHNGGSITQTLDLPGSVTPGVYNMVISGGDYRASKMFIVQ